MATTTDFFKVAFGAEDELSGPMAGIAAGAAKLLAGFVALQSVGDFFADSIKEAAEAEKVFKNLALSVERNGVSWAEWGESIERFAVNLQRSTGFSDEAIARSIQKFIDYGASGEEAYQRVALAADVSKARNIDLETTVDALARGQIGFTRGLVQLGIDLDENKSKTEQYRDALIQLSDTYSGRAAQDAGTLAGQVDRLNEEWGNFKETVGGEFLPTLTNIAKILRVTVETNNDSKAGNVTGAILNVFTWTGILMPMRAAYELMMDVGDAIPNVTEASKEAAPPILGMSGAFGEAAAAMDRLNKAIDERLKTMGPELEAEAEKWQQTLKMMRGQDLFDGLGDSAHRGFSKMEDALGSFSGFGEDGPMSMMWEHDEEVAKNALDRMLDHQAEYEQFALASTGQLTSEIAGMFVGLETDLKSVFRNIAKDWITLVLNEILKQTAIKLGQQLFGLLFQPQAHVLGNAIGASGPMSPLGKIGPTGVSGAGVVNNYYNGVFLTEDEYVNGSLVPRIERGAEFGLNRLALAERL